MKKLIISLATALSLPAAAQTAAMFEPYRQTDLRMPSVPIVVSDPYFSIWSPYDNLNDGPTRHWTDESKPIEAILRVDGVNYRVMGMKPQRFKTIVPMADETDWVGAIMREYPGDGWQNPAFDDSAWQRAKAAFGSSDLDNVRTPWSGDNTDIYVRREVQLAPEDLNGDLALIYSHDDAFELFVNGEKVADTGVTWRDGVVLPLNEKLKSLLKPGRNVIAAHGHNTNGGAFADFGLYRDVAIDESFVKVAPQISCDVMPTSTYYTFDCGPVEMDLVFTAPMIIDDYDLLSSPINYISYRVRSKDGKPHDSQLLLTASPRIAQNFPTQPTASSLVESNGVKYLRTGTVEQPVLMRRGDHVCIDWGYLYLPAVNGEVCLGDDPQIRTSFFTSGKLPESKSEMRASTSNSQPLLAYVHDFGNVADGKGFAMIGYDEVFDIEYFHKRYKAYWAHDGQVSIFDMFDRLADSYSPIMNRCRAFDKMIYDDAYALGGKEYAELLSGSYRHVIAAHKLFKDDQGNLLFFSKENDSNGCVNTVDLTYPEAPLFLSYNPELQKAMMTSILDYSASGRWTKPFAAHDLGTYPTANGQVYGGDMPLEEAGNMLTLLAMCSKLDGNTRYADKYWDIIQTWADYLSDNGQYPANQLCTDDFAGHWANNANLSIKAIMGIAGFAEMAALKGDMATYEKYNARAKEMAAQWEKDAREGDKKNLHYRLAFDRPDTWSQKYNMVWDKIWGTQIFPAGVMEAEVKYYLTKQNEYGLPLDCRRDYTKSDWILWTAAMAPDDKTVSQFVAPVYKYVNETPTRVPISDWYDTVTGAKTGFMARSVIGGHWMPLFVKKANELIGR